MNIQTADIAIVGAGITGLSTAFHLKSAGKASMLLFSSPTQAPAQSELAAAGLVTAGLIDNFTRVCHRHGLGTGKATLDFSLAAFAALETFCRDQKLPFSTTSLNRLILTEAELVEAREAVHLLNNAGASASLEEHQKQIEQALSFAVGEHIRANQVQPCFAGHVDTTRLLTVLRSLVADQFVASPVVKIENSTGDYTLHLANGAKAVAKMVVLANHLHIPDFIPQLKDAFVSTQEQWSIYSSNLRPKQYTVLLVNHAHEIFTITPSGDLWCSGARFLRKLAGFGFETATHESKVDAYLEKRVREILPSLNKLIKKDSIIGLDCRPCDELPIIGPMFGEDRILLAGGYMGQGLSFGFLAGKCLSDLIIKGKASTLPNAFHPHRLRSLPQD